jgi:phage tail sheath gpL-like
VKYLPNEATPLTSQRLLDALADLGIGLVIDPEHGPAELTDEHIPDLLGALAGVVDTYSALICGPGEDAAAARYMHGYLSNGSMDSGHRATEVTLSQIGGRVRVDAALVQLATNHTGAALAAAALELASTLTLYAAALAYSSDENSAAPMITEAEVKAVHKEVRRQLTAVRGTLTSTERALKVKGYRL